MVKFILSAMLPVPRNPPLMGLMAKAQDLNIWGSEESLSMSSLKVLKVWDILWEKCLQQLIWALAKRISQPSPYVAKEISAIKNSKRKFSC